MSSAKEEVNVSKMYSENAKLSKNDFISKFGITENGVSSENAEQKIKNYGLNEIKKTKPKRWYNYLCESLFTPFNCILLGIVIVLFYTDVHLAETPSYANIIVIFILVTASTLLDFFEEYKSNKAAEKLKEMVATTTTVVRDGKLTQIPIKNVVLGDTVILSAGSMIPADLRLIEAKDLYVGQSALTGESESVKKEVELEGESGKTNVGDKEINNIADFDNICFMGTSVISGSAKGVVIKTGDATYFGKIARTIVSDKNKTAFQKEMESISKLLIRFMLILIPIVFILNVEKHNIITAFTFAVAIAICITPLLLPVILSSSLSKGAIRMSKKKTIVKKLDSIQNFGAMNILCTDKTGTLTEDKIVLEKYLDVHGDENIKILKYAFLNSSFQTGLKGSIDEAIIKRAEQELGDFKEQYSKVDEIPFDFSRRRLSVIVTAKEQVSDELLNRDSAKETLNKSDRLQEENSGLLVSESNKSLLITKGAVEEILSICSNVEINDKIEAISKSVRDNIRKIAKKLNEDGLRVIAICKRSDVNNIDNFSVSDEKNMTFLGFVGFLDPPKESARASIERMNQAGIRAIVLTGDNKEVTRCVCNKVGINSKNIVDGNKIEKLSDMAVLRILRNTNIFVKLSPIQKARIVRLLRESGNIVGYMGDGINDSPSLTNSDVGISVDTAVDIAKESADIILIEKDLNVLLEGVKEGRFTFANLMKYIKMATSFNFGEVMSVIIASAFLPFLPETPIQLLVEGLLYDFGQLTIPFDNVDKEYLEKPKILDVKSLKRFMLFMGPVSSVFDIVIFLSLWFVFKVRDVTHFQTIWFTYSIVSNLIGMHIIRTSKTPFVKSNASKAVYASSILLIAVGIAVPFTVLGKIIGLAPMGVEYILLIFVITLLYCVVASFAKKIYMRKYGEWI